MASRSIVDLDNSIYQKYIAFDKAMREAGLMYLITCTLRHLDEQKALYAQGRESLVDVNRLRIHAGLPPITAGQNKKVTWTMNSKHLPSPSGKSLAFDIVILDSGRASWDIKVDVNDNEIPDYTEAGKIGESVGLKWGGRFKSPDYPHFEV